MVAHGSKRANPEPAGGERRNVLAVWEWFLGCCDAGDVIDTHQCIISIMRSSGGTLNRLLPGVGDHGNAKSGWNSSTKRRCASLVAIEIECVCVSLKTLCDL